MSAWRSSDSRRAVGREHRDAERAPNAHFLRSPTLNGVASASSGAAPPAGAIGFAADRLGTITVNSLRPTRAYYGSSLLREVPSTVQRVP